MITAPERGDVPMVADERTILEAWLDYHRATLARKCSGLTPEQLRERPVPPSPLSLVGLIRHMAEVERGWFTSTLADEERPRSTARRTTPMATSMTSRVRIPTRPFRCGRRSGAVRGS